MSELYTYDDLGDPIESDETLNNLILRALSDPDEVGSFSVTHFNSLKNRGRYDNLGSRVAVHIHELRIGTHGPGVIALINPEKPRGAYLVVKEPTSTLLEHQKPIIIFNPAANIVERERDAVAYTIPGYEGNYITLDSELTARTIVELHLYQDIEIRPTNGGLLPIQLPETLRDLFPGRQ